MNYETILDRLEYWYSEDQRWQGAHNALAKVIAPSSYPLFIESQFVEIYLDGLCGEDKGETSLYDWLTYWLYEARNMNPCPVTDERGNKYDFTKRKQVIKFLTTNFPL